MQNKRSTRRKFILGSAAAGIAATHALDHTHGATDKKNSPIKEFTLRSTKKYSDPFWDIELDVLVTAPDGKQQRIPAFWSGGNSWRWRFSAMQPGQYRYETIANDKDNASLHGVKGNFQITGYDDDQTLFKQGALQVSADKRYLETSDKKPFLWLGDTWWMALTERLQWPEDFKQLATDRRKKGFNLVQIVAGLYPDMDSFDARGKNEAGFPWQADYATIRPEWWDLADQRIEHLVEAGLMPCILACWGYYLNKMGMKKIKAHWRYVIARWGAYPVVWCLAGEGSMPWYLSKSKKKDKAELEEGWTEIARYVRKIDSWQHLITMHPTRSSREVVRDPGVVDFDMLQTGHNDYRSIPNTLERISAAVAKKPLMPVLQSEVCYEGIMAECRQDIQRFMFWSSMLNGCCGFTYGANGVWQVNTSSQPFGPSPHGRTWGNTPWQQAMNYPGSHQIGLGAQFLRTLPWQKMSPHPEWVMPHWNKNGYHNPSAAGIPKKLRIIYTPTLWSPPKLLGLEKGLTYQARLFNPASGELTTLKPIQGNAQGEYQFNTFPEQRDWVIVLER